MKTPTPPETRPIKQPSHSNLSGSEIDVGKKAAETSSKSHSRTQTAAAFQALKKSRESRSRGDGIRRDREESKPQKMGVSRPSSIAKTPSLFKSSSNQDQPIQIPSEAASRTYERFQKMQAVKKSKEPKKEITVNIKNVMGKSFSITLWETDTIGTLKEAVAKIHEVAPDSQMLVFCGQQLTDDHAVLNCLGIQDQSNLQLVLKMAGGL
jgi:hypothetical protein